MIKEQLSLKDKVILVTGASSGIGKAIASSCAEMGATVLLQGRNMTRLQDTLAEMDGSGHRVLQGDLTSMSDIEALVSDIPQINGVVHCAGIGSRIMCKFITPDDVDEVMGTNFKSAVLLQAQLLQQKKMAKASSIVFITSSAAEKPSIGNALYSASKGALISYARCLGLELAPKGIRVNCISPAMVWTNLALQGGMTEELLHSQEQNYQLGRYGKPEDISGLAVYMLSDASSWMTGSVVEINGGGVKNQL